MEQAFVYYVGEYHPADDFRRSAHDSAVPESRIGGFGTSALVEIFDVVETVDNGS